MDIGFLFNEILVRPIVTSLVAVYQILFYLHIPYALGFSIILLTVIIKILLYPLTASYLKTAKKMQAVAPHVSRLKEKHKGDNMRIQQETMKLYKEHGVNPAAGCLPSLLQIPIIWALYTVLQKIVMLKPQEIVSEVNKLIFSFDGIRLASPWDQYFFGIPLGKNPSDIISTMPIIMAIPVITGVLQLIQSKMIMPASEDSKIKKIEEQKQNQKKDEKKSVEEDFSKAFQTQSLYIFPAMIAFFSYTFPIGISLYWNTQTLFAILQQYKIQGLGGLNKWKEKFWVIINKQ